MLASCGGEVPRRALLSLELEDGHMSRRRPDSRSGAAAGLLGDIQTPISCEPLEGVYDITGELGR